VCAFESKSLPCRPPLTTNSGHNTDLRAVSRDGQLFFGYFVELAQPKFPQLFASTSLSTSQLTRGVCMALLVSLLYISFCIHFSWLLQCRIAMALMPVLRTELAHINNHAMNILEHRCDFSVRKVCGKSGEAFDTEYALITT
jgi:hypothetical protein